LAHFPEPWLGDSGRVAVTMDESRGFLPFPAFGTPSAIELASLPNGSAAGSGRKTMTFSSANLQQLAISALGALFAATLFISAAVGPAGQLV
jgi:hypothetical protein